MTLNPSIDFSTLRYKIVLWCKRYPSIDKVCFYNSISGKRPYILLFQVNTIQPDYVSGIGMGLKSDTPEAREILECHKNKGKLDEWEIFTKTSFSYTENEKETLKTEFLKEGWFGSHNGLSETDFFKIAHKESEQVLFQNSNLRIKSLQNKSFVSGDSMESTYSKINFNRLKTIAGKWVRRYPFIEKINFFSGVGKKYFIDVVLDRNIDPNNAAAVEMDCSPIDLSPFYNGLVGCIANDSLNDTFEKWEISTRMSGEDITNDLTPDSKSFHTLFQNTGEELFPELNLDDLKRIVQRLVSDYGSSEHTSSPLVIDRISLYHYAIPTPRKRHYKSRDPKRKGDPTRYAVVFGIPDYKRRLGPDANYNAIRHKRKRFLGNNDPLELFIADTEYYGAPPEKSILLEDSDFEKVYTTPLDEDWFKEWCLIPKHKGFILPDQVRVVEGHCTLYDSKWGEIGLNKEATSHLYKADNKTDGQVVVSTCERSFVYEGDTWRIYFEDKNYSLNDNRRVRYMLEAIKNPRETISYSKVIDIVSGSNETDGQINKNYSGMGDEELKDQEGLFIKYDGDADQVVVEKQEAQKVFLELQKQYDKLANGTEKDKKSIQMGIQHFEENYGYKIIKIQNSIKLGKEIFIPSQKAKRNADTITTARRRFLSDLKKKAPELHTHFKDHLIAKNGLVYKLSTDQPQWEIIYPS